MIKNGIELPKDATISSQLSEYDNVPYLPDHYYASLADNNRRIFDPSFDVPSYQPRYNKRNVQTLPVLRENSPLPNSYSSASGTFIDDETCETLLSDCPKLHQFPTDSLISTKSEHRIIKSR